MSESPEKEKYSVFTELSFGPAAGCVPGVGLLSQPVVEWVSEMGRSKILSRHSKYRADGSRAQYLSGARQEAFDLTALAVC